jgi:hypothetical protein
LSVIVPCWLIFLDGVLDSHRWSRESTIHPRTQTIYLTALVLLFPPVFILRSSESILIPLHACDFDLIYWKHFGVIAGLSAIRALGHSPQPDLRI